jgi:ABC-type multidrug transport system fused ATPase/permease subunit
LGANVIADFEGGLVGVQYDNADQMTSNFSYNACVGMMFFDAVWYGALAWYLDKVFPSEYGTQLPWYFPFLPSFWCDCFFKQGHRYENLEDADAHQDTKHAQYFEPVAAELKQQVKDEKCVSIRGLRRVFKNPAGGDDRVAVQGLDLDLYQGQVTVLLGHNGAGKTTTISMLVGMIPPTSGEAVMPDGYSITQDMGRIRKHLGVCPQHDILFPDLTPMQHLQVIDFYLGLSMLLPDELYFVFELDLRII